MLLLYKAAKVESCPMGRILSWHLLPGSAGCMTQTGRVITKHWTAKDHWYLLANSQQSFVKLPGWPALLSHHCCLFKFVFFFTLNLFSVKKSLRSDLQLGMNILAQTVLSRFMFARDRTWTSKDWTSSSGFPSYKQARSFLSCWSELSWGLFSIHSCFSIATYSLTVLHLCYLCNTYIFYFQ